MTAGVSSMTNASKIPCLKIGHATQTDPRAREEPPAVFKVIDSSNRSILPIAPAARMNLSAKRVHPQPASTMNLSMPRCAGNFSLHPAAAAPRWVEGQFSSDASQKCQTSSAKSDGLSCASLDA
eukprot:6210648-Pyramimonas_sp.AAC.1